MIRNTFIALFTFSILASASANAACYQDRAIAFRGAQSFAEHLEQFDTILHENNADEELLHWVHHFEEGFLDFVEVFQKSETCKPVVEDFQHFHEDVQELYRELSKRPQLFHIDAVLRNWNKLVIDYIQVQNNLY